MPNTSPTVDSAPILRSLREPARRDARIPVGFLASDHHRPRRRVADRDGRAARVPARSASPTTASPSTAPASCARRCSTRSSWAGSSRCTRRTRRSPARASCTRAWSRARLGLAGIPSISESTLIARDAAIARYEGGRIHIQHLSARESVEAIAEAKARGVQITCEACPHHLTLTDEASAREAGHAAEDEPAAAHRGRPPGADPGPARTARSTASPPTTRRTRARRRRCRSSRRRWARRGLETAFAAVYTAEHPAARADRREAQRRRRADGPADAGDRRRPRRRPGADRPRRRVGGGRGRATRAARENCCFAGRRLKGKVHHHDRRRRDRLPRAGR